MSLGDNRPSGRSPRLPAGLLAALLLVTAVLSACGGGGSKKTDPSRSPVPTFTAGKPGGTLRVVGSVRSVPLDPALARSDAALLLNRLIFRQLYSYRPGNPQPTPDLALGPPVLSSNRLTATITLRTARWNTSGGRNVTSGDVLRSMKRLCAPAILAPERGYLSQVVVGYAEFCAKASRVRLGAGKPVDLDNVDVPGLRAVGDNEVQILLRRPTADLMQILALPAMSPLPFEIKEGFSEPTALINDGPYHFIQPESGEAYRLSRNPSWDPGTDPIRTALVDRVSFRGGLTAADVQQRLQTNDADLSWDVETPAEVLRTLPPTPSPSPSSSASPSSSPSSSAQTFGTAQVDDRDIALLAVGSRGPAARQLGALAVRKALAACLDRSALVTAFGGSPRATATNTLLTPDYLDVPDTDGAGPTPTTAAPQPSATGTPTGGGTGSGSGTSSPRTAPSASPSASPTRAPGSSAATAKPLTTAQCRAELSAAGLRPGSDFTLLAGDTDAERAAADVLRKRLVDAGLAVQLRVVPADRYGAVAALGGWDLGLIVERPDFAGSRAVLSPLLDPKWPGNRAAGAARRPSAWFGEMNAGLAEESTDAVAKRELGLSSTMSVDASFVAVLRLATVRTTGPNVGRIPPLPLLGNADPTNVALGVTRPGESTAPTPASS
ncbi:MAG TPA: ABC transporter substrate-binding protein [Frankiaceae bacterium]|nr:ABC transporter substrate-binding protein [Frankiaceae bacterium]